MLRASILALFAITGCSASPPPPCPCAPVQASAPLPASQRAAVDILKKSLPGVVLILNQPSDGKLGFGSGVLLDDHGLVLTNVHVVANASSLGAMLHDAARVSYTPMDGGLARYFFENHKDVLPAHLVRGDP